MRGKDVDVEWMPFEPRPYPNETLRPEGDYLRRAWRESVYPIARQMGVPMRAQAQVLSARRSATPNDFSRWQIKPQPEVRRRLNAQALHPHVSHAMMAGKESQDGNLVRLNTPHVVKVFFVVEASRLARPRYHAKLGSVPERVRTYAQTKTPRSDGSTHPLLADDHKQRYGRWPHGESGSIFLSAIFNWRKVDNALRYGFFGLEGGLTLASCSGNIEACAAGPRCRT